MCSYVVLGGHVPMATFNCTSLAKDSSSCRFPMTAWRQLASLFRVTRIPQMQLFGKCELPSGIRRAPHGHYQGLFCSLGTTSFRHHYFQHRLRVALSICSADELLDRRQPGVLLCAPTPDRLTVPRMSGPQEKLSALWETALFSKAVSFLLMIGSYWRWTIVTWGGGSSVVPLCEKSTSADIPRKTKP